ncbi:FAD:protein FMN transferase [Aureibaculum sp. 2210JD6-5]|uniref:FAD:protein FMN transferase n=1 Tax=Aureibaculum sp. 2210JD6-5 TaxID=3103957 RepID=UPI002AAEC7BE|nr:FAD:protein FMN transferase [Aureibaculum sp. 2210JD6-5]MDY7396465.1 FAD:protein FMN transferase [Aureibaculum sp. 2210JD6-5]
MYEKFILFFILFFILCSCKEHRTDEPLKLEGLAFGTTYHITYFDKDGHDFSKSMDSLFYEVNKSMSTYISNSDISKINSGDTTIVVDSYFKEVFEKSSKIYQETDGIFDPTIGILVNAWGFGPEKPLQQLDSAKVKQLLNLVGFNKVKLQNDRVFKTNDSIYFDFNAIAKGYAVDIAGRFLETRGIDNYLVEIGGELRTRGLNKTKGKPWKVGIENPNFDGTRSIEKTVELHNEAMATSGNYRKFKVDSITGKKYAHIINSKTGYPAQSNLLSVSVIAQLDCADVDAYATAIMAMPLKSAKDFLDKQSQLKAFIIYSDNKGGIKTFSTSNF